MKDLNNTVVEPKNNKKMRTTKRPHVDFEPVAMVVSKEQYLAILPKTRQLGFECMAMSKHNFENPNEDYCIINFYGNDNIAIVDKAQLERRLTATPIISEFNEDLFLQYCSSVELNWCNGFEHFETIQ